MDYKYNVLGIRHVKHQVKAFCCLQSLGPRIARSLGFYGCVALRPLEMQLDSADFIGALKSWVFRFSSGSKYRCRVVSNIVLLKT